MGIQTIFGRPGNRAEETVRGTSGDDWIYPLGGYDFIDGGDGYDRVYVAGLAENFKLIQASGNATGLIDATSAASPMGATLINVEEVAFSDRIVKLGTPERFLDKAGQSDFFTGGLGLSTVVYGQEREDYTVTKAGRYWKVSERFGPGVDTLEGIERIKFIDKTTALDLESPVTGSAARNAAQLLSALFSDAFFADPANQVITGRVIDALERKTHTEKDIAQLAIDLNIIAGLTPGRADGLVRTIAANVLQLSTNAVPEALVTELSSLIRSDARPEAPMSPAEFIVAAADYVQLAGLANAGLEYLAP